MVEFYFKYFKKSYSRKITQLIFDIERLLFLENIEKIKSPKQILNNKFQVNLKQDLWVELNNLYYTLETKKLEISNTLSKFINKSEDNRSKKYKFIDAFAGCGGLSLGLSKAGFNPLLINEIEPKFLETYYFNHNLNLDNYFCDDIKKLVDGDLLLNKSFRDVDLVVGGPPCQGFSMANRQRLIDDPRNELYKYFLKLLEKTHPKFFVMENVKGMMNKSDEVLSDFKSTLGENYNIRIIVLNAKNYGIPQNRERVFVIGTRLNNVDINKVISNIINLKTSSKRFFLKDALYGLPTLGNKEKKNKSKIENDRIGYKFNRNISISNDFTSYIGDKSEYLSNHINRYNNSRDIEIYARLPQGSNSLHHSIADIMPYSSRNHMFKDKYFKLNENEVCKTITSHMKLDCNMYIHPNESRGLSPREAARIQTFPDEYIFMGANNSWYAQIGNAVPVKLAQILGEELIKYLK